jgi:hypothetical protein
VERVRKPVIVIRKSGLVFAANVRDAKPIRQREVFWAKSTVPISLALQKLAPARLGLSDRPIRKIRAMRPQSRRRAFRTGKFGLARGRR